MVGLFIGLLAGTSRKGQYRDDLPGHPGTGLGERLGCLSVESAVVRVGMVLRGILDNLSRTSAAAGA
jgi:hypothetical protein